MSNKHEIFIKREGSNEMSSMQNCCSCGWKGRKFYAYEDLQNQLCKEERSAHIRKNKETD